MKKLLAVALAALIMICSVALAEGAYIGDMRVINCREWVSHRAEPSTESERIARIPLDSVIYDCYEAEEGWVYGMYCGKYGYISADYLEAVSESSISGAMLSEERNGVLVVGSYEYTDNGETYLIAAYEESGNILWMYEASCSFTTELQMVDAFVGGTEEKPLVIAFSAEDGLTALDFFTGETVWEIDNDTLSLGGSICHAVDENGVIYAGGYYGPDPVAISAEGEILWQADFLGAYYWLYEIEIMGDQLLCRFDMDSATEAPVTVLVAKNGDFIGLDYNN